jgi:hypothetical protein
VQPRSQRQSVPSNFEPDAITIVSIFIQSERPEPTSESRRQSVSRRQSAVFCAPTHVCHSGLAPHILEISRKRSPRDSGGFDDVRHRFRIQYDIKQSCGLPQTATMATIVVRILAKKMHIISHVPYNHGSPVQLIFGRIVDCFCTWPEHCKRPI